MNEKPLSKRQQDILQFTQGYMGEHGRPPTIREIGKAVGINSTSVVNYNLGKLEEKGYLDRDPDGSDAAERYWVIVKSLAVEGRFEDAQREAAIMVPKYRGTRWADDVERHVLAHPR